MAITNHDRIGKALDLLREGLGPFVEREVTDKVKARAVRIDSIRRFADNPLLADKPIAEWDASALLKLMWDTWNDVFRDALGFTERSLVSELRTWRNRWAHQERLSSDDADRALDSAERLLTAVSAPEADEVGKMKRELRRLVFDEQVRSEKRKASSPLIGAVATDALKPWREVATPHSDVASGQYQQAEFAADLWQVHKGEGSDEYRDAHEFFRRTYLTANLKRLLVGAVRRMAGQGGDPVVQLQTNFGGGKTHSMLALYHLFSGVPPRELLGIDEVLAEARVDELPSVRRAVLVGNRISPGNPSVKPDGTQVRTLWGELAWQLGGKAAFERVRQDDERATNPGDALQALFRDHGPCLVLIDEWVAYARQLHEGSDLPGGSFETQFTFAQALTEQAKEANCLVAISLPASDINTESPQAQADDAEVGGIRGRDALARLRNVIGRVDAPWRPASVQESFEIVRRRLFEQLDGAEAYKQRDLTARAFVELYNAQSVEFPSECRAAGYERDIQAAYPIHPEIFNRLYEDWSALPHFQRTRGVLRLMAAVIHSLWEQGDRSPLILPSTLPIDDARVQSELTRYLPDNWTPVIEKDVDGPNSLPLRIDAAAPNLGKHSATRRVARTVYLGSAPTTNAAHRGIDDGRVKLGCVMPGEPPAIFGDALRRLAGAATYLYQDAARVWYATQPTVTKLAEDRAEQLRRHPDDVERELEERLRANLRADGGFARVHAAPRSGDDVPDELEARLVVLSAEHAYSKEPDNRAENAAKGILESRGTAPRLHRNTLVFLAADQLRLQDLDEALRKYLAWDWILDNKVEHNLDPHQTRQAETQLKAADAAVTARLPETYQWLLTPEQATPQAPITWQASRLAGAGALAERAAKRLRNEELMLGGIGATVLRQTLDSVPLWRADASGADHPHVEVRQLVSDFAQYLYLPRLAAPDVLIAAVEAGVALLTWETDAFAYAEGHDAEVGRYRGLSGGRALHLGPDPAGLLVKPEVARKQLDAETPQPETGGQTNPDGQAEPGVEDPDRPPAQPTPAPKARRYHGSVALDATRVGRDAGRIADEVVSHLTGLLKAQVKVTLEIEAEVPEGAPDDVVRTVTENSHALKFASYGFEKS
ncbi:MAG: Swt1 family HEPN domain-containing protein [Gammaproteobacteria bacterium]|nr:Swt1 family HEPN domain-containing protein [Gammaproteobacteria bacterium]